jgi:hypothetical protein
MPQRGAAFLDEIAQNVTLMTREISSAVSDQIAQPRQLLVGSYGRIGQQIKRYSNRESAKLVPSSQESISWE